MTNIDSIPAPASIDCVECAYEDRGLHNAMPFAGIAEQSAGKWTNVAYGPCPVCGERTTALWGFDMEAPEDEEDEGFQMSDVEADADTLASAGWGTDEDYGFYGGGDEW